MDNAFETRIDRAGTSSVKWQFVEQDMQLRERPELGSGEDDLLPLWVADMDFRSPQPVVDALVARAKHGIYGYTAPTGAFYQSVVGWMRRRNRWEVQPEWILTTPGVVPAIHMLVRTFTAPGDKVLLQPPVYFPFFRAVEKNGAQIAENPLVFRDGRYQMDFADLETKARDPQVRLAILCSPHNPVGRVWTEAELTSFAEICIANNILIISDEIHGDIIFKGHHFTPLARIAEKFAQNSIVCAAPSKTFNLAGLHTSCIVIPNSELRAAFQETLQSNGLLGTNAFGLAALQAAYDHGEDWLTKLMLYLQDNLEYLEDFMAKHVQEISVVRPEGTYLVWLDCRKLGISSAKLQQIFFQEARVYLEDGSIFGARGEGFQRINIACPRSMLAEALERIRESVSTLPPLGAQH